MFLRSGHSTSTVVLSSSIGQRLSHHEVLGWPLGTRYLPWVEGCSSSGSLGVPLLTDSVPFEGVPGASQQGVDTELIFRRGRTTPSSPKNLGVIRYSCWPYPVVLAAGFCP